MVPALRRHVLHCLDPPPPEEPSEAEGFYSNEERNLKHNYDVSYRFKLSLRLALLMSPFHFSNARIHLKNRVFNTWDQNLDFNQFISTIIHFPS